MPIEPIGPLGCFHYPPFSRQSIHDSEELTALELAARTAKKVNEIIDYLGVLITSINGYEKSDNITKNRKLSPTGDFTGTMYGRRVISVLEELNSDTDKIAYLATQFSDGQTGFVIDGGFFDEDNIKKNYDGGVF